MADVMKKQSISYELAQKMAKAAITKARRLGVTENTAILDDGGNLKQFCRMDGAPTRSSWQHRHACVHGTGTRPRRNSMKTQLF
jgi:uncharacterized protein GlcG (DUF336 family)